MFEPTPMGGTSLVPYTQVELPPVTFCGIYAPNKDQAPFMEEVLRTIPSDCTVIAGDFNIVTRLSDRSPPKELSDDSIRFLSSTTQAGFHDPSYQQAPHTFVHRNGQYSARLDRCLIKPTPQYPTCISSLHRYPSPTQNLSDHIPVPFHLVQPEPIPRGSPFWRLNSRRLTDSAALALSSQLLAHTLPSRPALPRWESTKQLIRTFFSNHQRRYEDHGEGFSGEHPSLVSSDPLQEAYEKRLLLGRVSADRARELPTPMLTSLINTNITDNHIPAVRTPSGDACCSQNEISTSFREWFKSLFTTKPSSPTPLHRHIPSLPKGATTALSTPITAEDIMEVATATKKHSAPGIDGIPYLVYIKVPYLLSRVISEALHSGSFPPSWGDTIIRPILKPGQDPTLPKSYRPIALICCDYKLFTLVLTHRLRPELSAMFPIHQTGFIPCRSTHMAVMRLISLLHATTDSAPLLLDCEKAYDRVSHEWLEYCLTQANFPSQLVRLLMNVNSNLYGRVITNNRLSSTFGIHSGIRQGDPIAPILFIITMEPLLVELTARGIGTQAHCDDTAVILNGHNSADLLEVLALYEKASGAKLNEKKSVVITTKTLDNCPFQQSKKPERYLGLFLSPNKRLIVPETLIDECIDSMVRIKRLPLSLAGRMTVLSSYIRPKLLYRMAISSCPHLDTYRKAETWFISPSKNFIRDHKATPLFSDPKLRHPGFCFRIKPLDLSMQIRRASTLLRLIAPLRNELNMKTLPSNAPNMPQAPPPWRILTGALFEILPYLGIPLQRVDSNGQRNRGGKFIQTKLSLLTAIDPSTVRLRVRSTLDLNPLPLSTAQRDYFERFGARPRQLFKWVSRQPLRPHILSFIWRLLHHRLYTPPDSMSFLQKSIPQHGTYLQHLHYSHPTKYTTTTIYLPTTPLLFNYA